MELLKKCHHRKNSTACAIEIMITTRRGGLTSKIVNRESKSYAIDNFLPNYQVNRLKLKLDD